MNKKKTTNMRWLFSLVLFATFFVGLGGNQIANAALLGVVPENPQISYRGNPAQLQLTYVASTGEFMISGILDDSGVLPIRFFTDDTTVDINGFKFFFLRIFLDENGNVIAGNPNGDDLIVTGTIPADPDIPGSAYSGVLLKGEIENFGFLNGSGDTDKFDMRFTITGGSLTEDKPGDNLSPEFEGKDLGVTVFPENSTFDGSFEEDFEGLPKGNVGPIPQEGIRIEKFTNGRDEDDTNGPNDGQPPFTVGSTTVPTLNPGDPITWTYAVTNTGGVSYTEDQVSVMDPILSASDPGNPGPARQSGAPVLSNLPNSNTLLGQLGGTFYDDGDDILEPGEVWEYTATGSALDLSDIPPRDPEDNPRSPVILGCDPDDVFDPDKKGYNNTGVVIVPGDEDSDPSNYCPEPGIDIQKFTNGRDADDTNGANDGLPPFTVGSSTVPRFDVGDAITWTYAVTNTGGTTFDDSGPANEVEVADEVLTFFNGGLVPERVIGATNLRNLPNAVALLAQLGGSFYDNGDDLLEPGEVWEYEAVGQALDLSQFDPNDVPTPVVLGCDPDDVFDPDKKGYNNTGVVSVPGDEASDPSNYCPKPGIDIEKFTNGRDADDTNGAVDGEEPFTVDSTTVPTFAVGDQITWTYAVTNTGSDVFQRNQVVVTDEVLTLFNPGSPVPVYQQFAPGLSNLPNAGDLLLQLGASFYDDGDPFLEPGEVWEYEATGTALDLSQFNPRTQDSPPNSPVVLGCNPDRIPGGDENGYNNIGVVTVPGDSDSDPSDYCVEPETAKLGDRVWEDLDRDGRQDCEDTNGNGILGDIDIFNPDDPAKSDQGAECGKGITGVTVDLLPVDDTGECVESQILESTATNGQGFYLFDDLNPDDYCVRFVKPENFCGDFGETRFTRRNRGSNDEIDSDPNPNSGVTEVITLNAGDDDRSWDAGIYCHARLGDRVWIDFPLDGNPPNGIQDCVDTNNNGIIGDPGDTGPECEQAGVEGVTVNLYRRRGSQCADGDDIFLSSTTTDENGFYLFDNLRPRNYCVEWVKPEGSECTEPNVGNNNEFDSDGVVLTDATCGNTNEPITLESREDDRSWDLGIVIPGVPGIDIEKFTNGRDADDTNGANDGLPTFTVGSTTVPTFDIGDQITWTYAVTNTGEEAFDESAVEVSDEVLTLYNPGNPVPVRRVGAPTLSGLPNANALLAQLGGLEYDNGDDVLDPGEVWEYEATGEALDLSDFDERTQDDPPDSPVVLGCDPDNVFDPDKKGYNNTGVVTVPGAESSDPSNYCPEPGIDIQKFTNGRDADDTNGGDDGKPPFTLGSTTVPQFDIGELITWTYAVTNTGGQFYFELEVVVTDEVLTKFNTGNGPLVPKRVLGAPTLSNLPNADVLLAQLGGSFYDDGDDFLDPGEVWEYAAEGTALDLSQFLPRSPDGDPAESPVVLGCDPDDVFDPDKKGYNNIGVVTVPDTEDSDPSNYCPKPGILIEKFTNGRDADDTNGKDDGQPRFTVNSTTVPDLAVGDPVTWTYAVSNTGGVTYDFAEVEVIDRVLAKFDFGNTPSFVPGAPTLVSSSDPEQLLKDLDASFFDNGNPVLEPGEVWEYQASSKALDLSLFEPREPGDPITESPVVSGCNPEQIPGGDTNGYNNIGVVRVPDGRDSDPSDYCQEQPAQLGDRVWEDLNRDGIQDCEDTNGNGIIGDPEDEGEECDSGIEKAKVELLDVDINGNCLTSNVLETQLTDERGFYLFEDLDPADYCVRFTKPDICEFGEARFTLLNEGDDPAKDSDADPDTGVTEVIELEAGEIDLTWDAGVYCPARLGDRVWRDLNRDGIQDCEDTNGNGIIGDAGDQGEECDQGQEGVEVTLLDPVDGICGNGDEVFLDDTSTDKEGFYLFDNLEPGEYCVAWEKPFGFGCTIPNVDGVDRELDSDGVDLPGTTTCETVELITLLPRDVDRSWDLGIVALDCELEVEKTCEIIPDPTPTGTTCKDIKDITALTLIWDGVDGINIRSEVGQSITGINNGDVITLNTPKDQTGNDVEVFITGAVNGASEFHISCSDDQMNGIEDCGSRQGNGKSNEPGLINDWIFGGMTGEQGQFICPQATTPGDFPMETAECVYRPQPEGGNCKDIKDITALKLVWGGPSGLNIRSEVGQVINNIQNGELIILDTPKDQTGNDVEVFLSGSRSGQSEFHISCSDDDMNGPEDCGNAAGNGKSDDSSLNNEWVFGGMIGEQGEFGCPGIPGTGAGSADVLYGFRITNPNDEELQVRIVDVLLGIDQEETIPATTIVELTTGPFTVDPDASNVFTNTVVVDGEIIGTGATCMASDSVTVRRLPPPPQPQTSTCKDLKDVTSLKLIWNGPDAVNLVSETGQQISGISNGNVITLLTPKDQTGNDVDVFVSGAVNGQSQFHISCSDDDMNGIEDCGNAAGNGKKDESGLLNLWLFDGMTGEKGQFDCGLPNTGPPSGDPLVTKTTTNTDSGKCEVSGGSLRFEAKKVYWPITNNGDEALTINEIFVSWPNENEKLRKAKLDSVEIFKQKVQPSSTTITQFKESEEDRRINASSSKDLRFEFDKDAVSSPYGITVTFEGGCEVSY